MTSLSKNRIESLDLLKGLVMVIMALDHIRDYFHAPAFLFDPTDPNVTTLPIFFTRWITHFCAPTFCFLAGTSAFLISAKRSRPQLTSFLFKRGLWLVFIELTIVNFAWFFDVHFRTPSLLVIWSLGISMIVLSLLIHLPKKIILLISLLLIFGHNVLDAVHFENSVLWSVLHEIMILNFSPEYKMYIYYPVIPWIGVMSLGYCFGTFYTKSYGVDKRKKLLNLIGVSAITLFVIIRGINIYGDPQPWTFYDTALKTMMSFLNPSKYPPSLSYLLMTLGPALTFLANSEKWKNKVVHFFSTFGRVPFFYYILHIYLVHALALVVAQLTGFGWQNMILKDWVTAVPVLRGYGFGLWIVYLVWVLVIASLYPLCKKFDVYKLNNKDKWWLNYL